MKRNIATAPATAWNQKNLPSDIEQVEQSPAPAKEILEQLPFAAVGLARRHPGIFILTAAGILGLVWYLSSRD